MTAHALRHLQAWIAEGFHVVLILCVDDPTVFYPPDLASGSASILVRANEGYDFAAWATAVLTTPGLSRADFLITVNDSVFGPFNKFSEFIRRITGSEADYVGALESREIRPHYQSFLLGFSKTALQNKAFWSFWNGIRIGGRDFVINHYEVRMLDHMRRGGLTAEPVLAAPADGTNQTLNDWRGLLDAGFPYVKVQLLRDNPHGADLAAWRETFASRGYDPDIVDRYLAALRD